MDKQTKNIAALEDGRLRFKTGRVVTTKNEVVCIKNDVVYFKLNRGLIGCVDLDDYCRFSLWAQHMCYSHGSLAVGGITFDSGYAHLSVSGLVMRTTDKQMVSYRNGNRCDIRKANLYIRGTN
jgi:hypothetical protein